METEELLEFSGEIPSSTMGDTDPPLLDVVSASSSTPLSPTSSPYDPSALRIAWLAAKCVLSLLILVLTAAIRRRDFIKVFVAMLLIPILLECGFDIYTEILSSTTFYGNIERTFTIYHPHFTANSSLHELQSEAVALWADQVTYYTTYNIYKTVWYIPLASYAVSDLLLWSTLFSTPVAFYFAHKAITQPEEITYIHFIRGFLNIQILPILLTVLDCLLAEFQLPWGVRLAATAVTRISACLVAFTILAQAFWSFATFCKRKNEYTKTSPYDQVREAKSRLFFFILYQIVIQVLNIPFLVWAGVSLAEDYCQILNIGMELPLNLTEEAFSIHLSTFLLRSMLVLFVIPILLSPYRKKFLKSFCRCCLKN